MQVDVELKNVIFETEGNLATITINRPKALNALNERLIMSSSTQ